MRRFALAIALLAASPVLAQPPAPNHEKAGRTYSGVSYGPHLPIYKSGGHILGRDGIYPYDSGEYLLSGSDGLTRSSGGFTMELPGAAPALTTGKHWGHSRSGLFRR